MHPALGTSTGKASPLTWLVNHWGLLEGCKKPRLCTWRVHAQTCLLLVPAQRSLIENCLLFWSVFQKHPRQPPAHTGLLLHCLLLWHCSLLVGRLPLLSCACALGKKWSQLRSVTLNAQAPTPPLTKVKTTITKERSPTPLRLLLQSLGPWPYPPVG